MKKYNSPRDYIKDQTYLAQDYILYLMKIIEEIVPDTTLVLSYGMPTFKYKGKSLIGCLATKNHFDICMMNGSSIQNMRDILTWFSTTKSMIQIPYDKLISKTLLKKIIKQRVKEIW